jgi:hypothetical protein
VGGFNTPVILTTRKTFVNETRKKSVRIHAMVVAKSLDVVLNSWRRFNANATKKAKEREFFLFRVHSPISRISR